MSECGDIELCGHEEVLVCDYASVCTGSWALDSCWVAFSG